MQKRFLHIAIRKYDFVEKRAGKARKPKPEKRASRNPKSTRAEIQKSARAEAGKAREPKKEKP